jgi:hypothetical protein
LLAIVRSLVAEKWGADKAHVGDLPTLTERSGGHVVTPDA